MDRLNVRCGNVWPVWPFPLGAFALALALLAVLSGCSTPPDDSRRTVNVTGDFGTPFQIQINNFVRRQPPAVYVAPQGALNRRPRALFVPLRVTQQIANPVSFSDMKRHPVWKTASVDFRVCQRGNVINLGGLSLSSGNNLVQAPSVPGREHIGPAYLNSFISNCLKVLMITCFFGR